MRRDFQIRADHPLRLLFTDLIDRHMVRFARIEDPEIAAYLSRVLVDFTHSDRLYRIRNSRGKRLEDVGEMMIESNPAPPGRSFVYEREVRKHIGDYTLFISGLFPEHVQRLRLEQRRLDSFVDYVRAGKESYRMVASFDQAEFQSEAPLFRRLSDRFELCVFGLNLVKQELEHNQRTWYAGVKQIVEN
jgi:hypothetical protein